MNENYETNDKPELMPQRMTPALSQEVREEYKRHENEERVRKFEALFLPALFYAAATVLLTFKNYSGITLPVYVIVSILFVLETARRLGKSVTKQWLPYGAAMLLLGIGNTRTASGEILFYSNLLILILTVGMVWRLLCDETGWSVGRYILSFWMTFFGTIVYIGEFFADLFVFATEKKSGKSKNGVYIAIGILIFLPIGAVIVSLLASADAVFGNLVDQLLRYIFFSENIILIPGYFLLAFFAGYCGLRYVDKGSLNKPILDEKRWPALVAGTVMLPLTLIYMLFSGIQIFSLFLMQTKLPAGYTYAGYAREGFFQLMAVCLINVILVLIVLEAFQEHVFTKALLILFCLCTYIMLASSAYRLYLYIAQYQLTMLRIEVILALIVIAICMLLVMITVFKKDFPLMHAGFAVITAAMIILVWIRPDAVIAGYNLSHINEHTDYDYLSNLSYDAAPYICGQTGSWVDNYILNLNSGKDENILHYNFSRANARKLFGEEIQKNEETVTIFLYNFTGRTLTNIGHNVGSNGKSLFAGGCTNADGTEIVYKTAADIARSENAYRLEIDRSELGEDPDTVLADGFAITYSFEMDGITYSAVSEPIHLKWGETCNLYLELYGEGDFMVEK